MVALGLRVLTPEPTPFPTSTGAQEVMEGSSAAMFLCPSLPSAQIEMPGVGH